MSDNQENVVGDATTAAEPGTSGGFADEAPESGTDSRGFADETPSAGQDGTTSQGQDTGGEDGTSPTPAAEPEPYELTAPDDFPIPGETLQRYTAKARELGLTKAQAEGMLQWHKRYDTDVRQYQRQAETQMLTDWGKQIGADPEFGGANLKTTMADASRALKLFDNDGSLRQLLIDSKAQFHPAVIRAMARVGKAMGEDVFASGGKSSKTEIPLEERMYPNWKI